MAEIPLLGYLFTVETYKFEITAAILITNNFPRGTQVKKGWELLNETEIFLSSCAGYVPRYD
jgi:hypothetical protein